jgi:hypothetical protein
VARFIVTATWDDVPHLTKEAKDALWASIPAYQRDARIKGIPQLGAGIIFPIPEEDILVDAFTLPAHWLRGYGLDVGWNRTAALWRAKDPDTGISYFYDEHYRGEADPEIHAAAIRRRGSWIPGRIDPAARGRSQKDGIALLKTYRRLLYNPEDKDDALGAQMLKNAKNGVESGLYDVLMALNQGLLKVMRGRCPNWLAERRLYRRNEKGEVVKKFDHAMDAGRYNFASGDAWLVAQPAPVVEDPLARFRGSAEGSALGWMR